MANAKAPSQTSNEASIVDGPPLGDEAGLGALTIPGYLLEISERFAEREALAWRTATGAERWSYATLRERSFEVARALVACGVGKDTRVGILMTNRPEFLAAMFGTALAGGVGVPLNTFSTAAELEHLIGVSCISVLLFERHVANTDFAAVLAELEPALATGEPAGLSSPRFPFLRRVAVIDDSEGSADARAIEPWPEFLQRGSAADPAVVGARAASVKPADAGAIFFSSGTTSLPKGVLHAQRAVAIQWWRWPSVNCVCDGVRGWGANGFFWSGNFSMILGTILSSGGTIVLQPTFDAEEALDLIRTEQVSWPYCWPHQWAKLQEAPSWKTADLASVRYIDASTPVGRHPTVGATWHEPPAFGTTETLTMIAAFPSTMPPGERGGAHGVVLPGNTVKIVDPLTGIVVPRGARGEIAVKGATLMLGYLGVPRDETLDAQGFFHNGDGGYLDDLGRLFWEGRLTEVVKTGGANVSPREVDTVLAQHAGVKRSQTLGIPHDTLGEMVVTCIVPHEGTALDEPAIRAFARRSLASYKVPRRVLFFRDDELTTTGSDKLRTDALREQVARRLDAERDEIDG
jgi:fatty-acyl-CoA synthase